ncbi:MAG TPA: exosortase H-associated membrane protein [Usitatibacter sp.]|nr:exosortase H-associated membrane protein [Usitatibacter sp.]
MRISPVWQFVLRAFAWLPLCFAAWYFAADWYARPLGWIARFLVSLDGQGLVTSLEFGNRVIVFVTRLEIHEGVRTGVLTPEVSALVYTFGLPLFLALMLASKASWRRILLGVAVLLPFEAWSVAFDALTQIAIRSGFEVTVRSGYSAWGREVLALGYQLGALIFPTVAPIITWGFLERRFIAEKLAGSVSS